MTNLKRKMNLVRPKFSRIVVNEKILIGDIEMHDCFFR